MKQILCSLALFLAVFDSNFVTADNFYYSVPTPARIQQDIEQLKDPKLREAAETSILAWIDETLNRDDVREGKTTYTSGSTIVQLRTFDVNSFFVKLGEALGEVNAPLPRLRLSLSKIDMIYQLLNATSESDLLHDSYRQAIRVFAADPAFVSAVQSIAYQGQRFDANAISFILGNNDLAGHQREIKVLVSNVARFGRSLAAIRLLADAQLDSDEYILRLLQISFDTGTYEAVKEAQDELKRLAKKHGESFEKQLVKYVVLAQSAPPYDYQAFALARAALEYWKREGRLSEGILQQMFLISPFKFFPNIASANYRIRREIFELVAQVLPGIYDPQPAAIEQLVRLLPKNSALEDEWVSVLSNSLPLSNRYIFENAIMDAKGRGVATGSYVPGPYLLARIARTYTSLVREPARRIKNRCLEILKGIKSNLD